MRKLKQKYDRMQVAVRGWRLVHLKAWRINWHSAFNSMARCYDVVVGFESGGEPDYEIAREISEWRA